MNQASHTSDVLTGAIPRSVLNDDFSSLLTVAQQSKQPLCVLMIDLDHFKSINDAFGHGRGDDVLQEFAQRVQSIIRSTDRFYRYGGDEFVLLLPHTSQQQGEYLAQRVLATIQETAFAGTPPLRLTLSLGIASFPNDGNTCETLLEIADRRSYQAKRAGRGQLCATDSQPGQALLTPPERLIERDSAIEQIQHMLDLLDVSQRSLVWIEGAAGIGRSRMLQEIAKTARLQSFGVLFLQGNPAVRWRVFGALAQRGPEWASLPYPFAGLEVFSQAIQHIVEQQQWRGVVLIVDESSQIDRATLEILRDILSIPSSYPIALISDARIPGNYSAHTLSQIHYAELILQPLSYSGTSAWIRQSLRWEAPEQLMTWLFDVTGGLPGKIHQLLSHLIDTEALSFAYNTWHYHDHIIDLDPHQLLPHVEHKIQHNLPLGLCELVGREEELKQLALLTQSQRAVALIGPGGIGKTCLAISAASEQLKFFSDGIFWVSLTGVQHMDLALSNIARVLNLEATRTNNQLEHLTHALQTRRLMLVLDNVEQLSGELGAIQHLLDHVPGLHILATSRTPVAILDFQNVSITGLPMLTSDDSSLMRHSEAVQMFIQRARQHDPNFIPDQATYAAIVRICQLLQGMPLGIELAAAQLVHSSCAKIAEDLATGMARLNTTDPQIEERHRSLTPIIESFWRLLAPGEQQTLCKLGVFQGGFDTEAAYNVAQASPFFLHALASSGYLSQNKDGRYQLHELLRQYALQRLQEHESQCRLTLKRHSYYYLKLLHQLNTALVSRHSVCIQIDSELRNIRAAWEWALANGAAQLLAQAAQSFMRFCLFGGILPEAFQTFKQTVEQLEQRLSTQPLSAYQQKRIRFAIAMLKTQYADVAYWLSRYSESLSIAQEARAIAHSIQANEPEALAHVISGNSLIMQTRFIDAEAHFIQADAIAQKHRLIWIQGMVAMGFAFTANALHRYTTACDYFHKALIIFRSIGDRFHEADALSGLGNIAEDRGKIVADYFFSEALELYTTLGNREGEYSSLHNIGVVSMLSGRYTSARSAIEHARQALKKLGMVFGEGICSYNLGRIDRDLGRFHAAQSWFGKALEKFTLMDSAELRIAALNGLGNTHLFMGNLEDAAICYEYAETLLDPHNDRRNHSRLLTSMAQLAIAQRETEAAEGFAREALRVARELEHDLFESEALAALGIALSYQEQRMEEARDILEQALARLRYINQNLATFEVRMALARLVKGYDLESSQILLEPIISHIIQQGRLDGRFERGAIYRSCVEMLQDSQDRRMQQVLSIAINDINRIAQRLPEDESRLRYLSMPANQDLHMLASSYEIYPAQHIHRFARAIHPHKPVILTAPPAALAHQQLDAMNGVQLEPQPD